MNGYLFILVACVGGEDVEENGETYFVKVLCIWELLSETFGELFNVEREIVVFAGTQLVEAGDEEGEHLVVNFGVV